MTWPANNAKRLERLILISGSALDNLLLAYLLTDEPQTVVQIREKFHQMKFPQTSGERQFFVDRLDVLRVFELAEKQEAGYRLTPEGVNEAALVAPFNLEGLLKFDHWLGYRTFGNGKHNHAHTRFRIMEATDSKDSLDVKELAKNRHILKKDIFVNAAELRRFGFLDFYSLRDGHAGRQYHWAPEQNYPLDFSLSPAHLQNQVQRVAFEMYAFSKSHRGKGVDYLTSTELAMRLTLPVKEVLETIEYLKGSGAVEHRVKGKSRSDIRLSARGAELRANWVIPFGEFVMGKDDDGPVRQIYESRFDFLHDNSQAITALIQSRREKFNRTDRDIIFAQAVYQLPEGGACNRNIADALGLRKDNVNIGLRGLLDQGYALRTSLGLRRSYYTLTAMGLGLIGKSS